MLRLFHHEPKKVSQLGDLCGNGSKINIHQWKWETCKLEGEFLAKDRAVRRTTIKVS